MPIVKLVQPTTIRVTYRQQRDDKDYGSCLWADFDLDCDNYRLTINSDCGNFSYGWTPTPQGETFIHLCCRFDKDYLLNKLSDRTVLDEKKTAELFIRCFENHGETLPQNYEQDIYDIVNEACNEYEMYELIERYKIENTPGKGNMYLEDCFVKDYPTAAKRVVDIFTEHVVPLLKNQEAVKGMEHSNLVSAIKETERRISKLDADHQKRRKPLEDRLSMLRKENTVCEKCNGAKQVMRPRTCAEDDREREMITCPVCKGTGLARKGEGAE